MTQAALSEIVALENTVWQALVTGDAAIDARLLDDSFLGVYGTGFCDKVGHVGQLAHGPTIASYSLSQSRLILPGRGLALLCYRALFQRVGSDRNESMYVSSLWQHGSHGWRNIFSQDTPTADQAPV